MIKKALPPALPDRMDALVRYARAEREKIAPHAFICRRRHPRLGATTLRLWLAEGAQVYAECPECHHVYLLMVKQGLLSGIDIGLLEPRTTSC